MISIVGGTYYEECFHPHIEQRVGSGVRAGYSIRHLDAEVKLNFSTFSSAADELYLKNMGEIFNININISPSENSIGFYYQHPMATPIISPRPDLFIKPEDIHIEAPSILYYGFIEGNAVVNGDRVVYDPQSPVQPYSFKQTGSKAKTLVVIINFKEASLIAKSKDIEEIKRYFFGEDGAEILVVKMGAKGAMVFTNDGSEKVVPVYQTAKVWPIGSGDVFAAIFAYYWLEHNASAFEAAEKASFFTAVYSNTRNYRFGTNNESSEIIPLNIKDFPKGQVYLAGPFFSFAEKWVVNEVFRELSNLQLKVFSPLHHVGIGTPDSSVAKEDLKGLEDSAIVFAIVDGLDSGTLIEIGYALKMGIPVIVYSECEKDEDLTMLIGTGCEIVRDLTTAMYKCLWKLAENE